MIVEGSLTQGLFGQALTWILEILPHVDHIGSGLTCRIECPNYGVPPDFDCLAPYLDHVRPHVGEPLDLHSLVALKQDYGVRFTDFTTPHRLWNRYFAFKPHVIAEVDAFVKAEFRGTTLGVHYRGCDKMQGPGREGAQISYDEMDLIIDDFCAGADHCPETLFVASDEADYIRHVMTRFGSEFDVVVRQDSARNEQSASTPIFFRESRGTDADVLGSDAATIALGLDAICNALLLSRCDAVLKTSSALSAWAKILEPNLEIYRVNAFFPTWFPDADIPIYHSGSAALQEVLGRTLLGEGSIA